MYVQSSCFTEVPSLIYSVLYSVHYVVTPQAPYCTEGLTKMDSASDNGDSADMPDDAAAAYVNPTKMWRGRTDLKVYFIESDLEVLKRWMVDRSPMTPEVILAWAGEWNSELAKAIPRFARVDSPDSADIRIAFGSE